MQISPFQAPWSNVPGMGGQVPMKPKRPPAHPPELGPAPALREGGQEWLSSDADHESDEGHAMNERDEGHEDNEDDEGHEENHCRNIGGQSIHTSEWGELAPRLRAQLRA